MAGNLSVRNVDDDVIGELKRRAAAHGRSAEAEVREILRQTLRPQRPADFLEQAARIRAMSAGIPQTPAEVLMREGRDER
jgi:plasmid stability protein